MKKAAYFLIFTILGAYSYAQNGELPTDFREHTTIMNQSRLFNPVYSVEKPTMHNLNFWSRWQWQQVDGDPTTFIADYGIRLGSSFGAGVGYVQHNTGDFLQKGGMLNVAYDFHISPKVSVALGTNVFAFTQEFTGIDSGSTLPVEGTYSESFVQVAPGIRLKIDGFQLGFTSQNMFIFSDVDMGIDKVYMGHMSYDFPVEFFDNGNAFFRPFMYIKQVPDSKRQLGLGTLFSTDKFWAQVMHNNFYGVSVGGGARFFKKISVGALVEFGTDESIENEEPSFEIVTTIDLGKKIEPKEFNYEEEPAIVEKTAEEKEAERLQALAEAAAQRKKDSLAQAERDALLAEQRRIQQQKADSLAQVQRETELALQEKQRQDSIAKAKEAQALAERNKNERPATGRYEEVASQDGVQPGYYLIANVFGTKKYFDLFMQDLRKKGFEPGSFYRDVNKYNYVYLKRYDTLDEAVKARDSKFGGKYQDKTWIFRVRN